MRYVLPVKVLASGVQAVFFRDTIGLGAWGGQSEISELGAGHGQVESPEHPLGRCVMTSLSWNQGCVWGGFPALA